VITCLKGGLIVAELEKLARFYSRIQKVRVAIDNMITAAEKGRSGPIPSFWSELRKDLYATEKRLVPLAKQYLEEHPAWPWLQKVKGIGPVLAMQLLGLIGDVGRFPRESKLIRYAGLAAVDGKAERVVKGEKRHFNPELKKTIYLIGDSFIKQNNPYRQIYDEAKRYYAANRPDWWKKRVHYAAMRIMGRIFLSHLYLVWRKEAGMEVSLPWVITYGGHLDRYWPWEFVPDYEYRWKEEVLAEWREGVKAQLAARALVASVEERIGPSIAEALKAVIMAGQGPGYEWRRNCGLNQMCF